METEDLVRTRETLAHLLKGVDGAKLLERLRQNGWQDILQDDADLAIAGLFTEQGRALSASPALDIVLLSALHLDYDDCAIIYPKLNSEATTAGSVDQFESLTISGVCLCGFERARTFIVPILLDTGAVVLCKVQNANTLQVEKLHGLDPEWGLAKIEGKLPIDSIEILEGLDWLSALHLARITISYELTGVAEKMLEMAIAQVTDREQFGQAIGSFQTVKHRLADVYVEIKSSQLLQDTAIEEQSDFSSILAKCQSGLAALLASTHAQQVCGAMGWSWEFGLHSYVRRAHLLDAFLGSSSDLQRNLGKCLLNSSIVPRLGGLMNNLGEE